ncbi:transglutaminase-like domain-containing protein [Subtercola sp. PAMC28395]|uniref:transglutaminase-like domain-containing protein n=1 Tax=Subtercola sp. PAMC28395 TaxID=2846775 RepID=UPI001C0B8C52|nr:transglutaminase-like domain-containing protein [Subtercola sp. PAMC28395]QWT24554.1 transglutaminase-like domain-containing protein [Subtercola sp. PAMC28395]
MRDTSARVVARRASAQLIDLAYLAAVLGISVLGFAPIFGGFGYLIGGFGGLLLGLGIAYLGARLRWDALVVAAATIVAYFVLGGGLALRSTTIAGVIPSLDTLSGLAFGAVLSWKQLLTVQAPVAGFDQLLIVPFLSSLLAGVISASLALRLRQRWATALIPVVALFALSISLGTHETVEPLVRGVLLAGLSIGWVAFRRAESLAAVSTADDLIEYEGDNAQPVAARSRRAALAAGLIVVGLVVGFATAGAALPASQRHVLRDTVVPPLDLRAYPSPLESYRKYVRDFASTTLFTVSGLPDGARIRLATLDLYDGIVYNVSGSGSEGSGTFSRVGTQIVDTRAGTPATITITDEALAGVWMPDVGYLTALRFGGDRAGQLAEALHYNSATGVAVTTVPLVAGDSYTAEVIVPPTFTDEQLAATTAARLTMPKSFGIPDSVTGAADNAIGEATGALDQARALATTLHTQGFFSHGLQGDTVSRSGHSSERINTLLTGDQMVGDDEQYAVAMALEATQLGLPARVVMGFYPANAAQGSVAITGSDLHAWVEVDFQGAGWMTFDPTPPKDQTPQQQAPKQKTKPQPQVLQPPPPAQAPAELPPDVLSDNQKQKTPTDDWAGIWAIAGVAVNVLIVLAILIGPIVVIGVLKARRRRRRATAGRPSDRLSGGWSEVVDTAVDLGASLTPGTTRREGATAIAERFPESGVTTLAAEVDHGVFGPGEPSDEQVAVFWSEVDVIVRAMKKSVSRWRRARGRLSLRSFWDEWMRRAARFTEKRKRARR